MRHRDRRFSGIHITRNEGGFTTPAAAVAILVACSLVFVCTRGVTVETRSGQIQYVADAGALAADNVVAEFVTIGQVVDAVSLSLSLTGLTVYAVSAIAAFIPGAQGVAVEIANVGSKVFDARNKFMESAVKGLNAAQKALPAICAVRATQVIQSNAKASGIAYVGTAITSPIEGIEIKLNDGSKASEAAKKIEEKEGKIQEESQKQKQSQEQENAAKERAWLADCGNNGMSMYERAGKLSGISAARNPYYSSVERWGFSVALERAKAYYSARFNAEPGAGASGSAELVGESVARKQFYKYALNQVSQGYIETSASGSEVPHLVQLARNTQQIKETSLYTDAIYPSSINGDITYLHAYIGCPTYKEGSAGGKSSVSAIDSGSLKQCPSCKFDATTLGRVPSASTSINNGFEYHYQAVVEASREYAQAVQNGETSKQFLTQEQDSIGSILSEAIASLTSARYDPQPPGRYGCICIVAAPESQTQDVPFIKTEAKTPARIAISGATLAPDQANDQSNVIKSVGAGLIPQECLTGSVSKIIFGAWGDMLTVYTNGTEGIKTCLRKTLGVIPVVGTALSDKAAKKFENALTSTGLEPANLDTYKPVLVNTSHILKRDPSKVAAMIGHIKQAIQTGDGFDLGMLSTLAKDVIDTKAVQDLLDERGLTIASIPLSDIGLGSGKGTLYFPVPKDLDARIEEIFASFVGTLGGANAV